MKAILPANFNLNDHTNINLPVLYGINCFNDDHAKYILSQITLVPSNNKDVRDKMEDGYVSLFSVKLQAKVHNYRQYIDYFIQTNVIETDGIYIPQAKSSGKGKSYGYRFTAPYECKELISSDYTHQFANKLNKDVVNNYKEHKREYNHLLKWIYPKCNISIDSISAIEYIIQKRNAQLSNPDLLDVKFDNKYKGSNYKNPINQYKYSLCNIHNIMSDKFSFIIDKSVNRLHTPLTSLNSALRNLITYNGNRLVSIDIKNCQPYLSVMLFDVKSYYNIVNNNIYNKLKIPSTPHLPPMLEEIAQLSDKEDIMLYKSLVGNVDTTEADLYAYIETECLKQGVVFKDRASVKKIMFEVMFTKNAYRTWEKKLFSKLFPSVDKIFRRIKSEDNTLLPRLLQSIESQVMLKTVTKSVARQLPKIPIFTIHDSIITTEDSHEKVHKIMVAELTSFVGIPPKLKIDHLSPENLDWNEYQLTNS